MKKLLLIIVAGLICLAHSPIIHAQPPAKDRFQLKDVFDLEYASDPQISPDGKRVVYVRNFMDIMKDRARSNLWIIDATGKNHRPITTGIANDAAPRWSPDGKRLAYVSREDGNAVIVCRWMDSGDKAILARLQSGTGELVWSPDGKHLAFSMFVEKKRKPFVKLPPMPKGAEWAAPPKVIQKVGYRADGKGYLKDGFYHLFILPADGGAPRQLTDGPYNHVGKPVWTADGNHLYFSANRNKDWEYQPRASEIYRVRVDDGKIKQLTDIKGPNLNPIRVGADYMIDLGFDDRFQGYQITQPSFFRLPRDGKPVRKQMPIATGLDRSMRDLQVITIPSLGQKIYFQFDDRGTTKVGAFQFKLKNVHVEVLAENVGGTTIGRPYSSGSYSVNKTGVIAFTQTSPQRPADVAVYDPKVGNPRRLTRLNDDLLQHKKLGSLEEITYKSAHDGRDVQGWILKPPDFDAKKKYPLILEIHGGPFANYGPRFAAEMQLYAAAGYVVFYCNPRGSTSYGEKFGNLIHHNYPSNDYDDLMSGVNAVIERGFIDEQNLFVTGGSGGGVLTAWVIGKTGRFRAAVIGKPVINWFSFVLTADMYPFFAQYWFPGPPWEHPEHYFKRSPISLVGKVTTPAMILTGEEDHRTPMSESEQYYQALKLRKVETVLVRIPGASHNIAARPSQMIAKVACVLKWFNDHRK